MTAADLYAATLRLRAPVAAADRVHDVRTSLFLVLDDGDVTGVGECATSSVPGPDPTTTEVVAALDALMAAGAPRTAARADDLLVAIPPGTDLAARAARALLDAARLDLALRAEGRSLVEALGATASSVRFAGVVGVATPADAASRAAALIGDGATRLRVKVEPASPTASLEAVLEVAGAVPVCADGNGAFDPDRDADAIARLCALPLAWLEQPFGPAALDAHAALAARGDVRVGLDESVASLDALRAIATERAADVVCVKPARVGGITAARAVVEAAVALGLAAYVGGAFEAGLGRAVLGAVAAAHAGPDALDGDVVAPVTYLVADPCALAPPSEGRQPLHLGAGCGPHPAREALEPVRSYGT